MITASSLKLIFWNLIKLEKNLQVKSIQNPKKSVMGSVKLTYTEQLSKKFLKNVQRQCTQARITNLPLESVAAKTQKPKRKSNEQTYCGISIEIANFQKCGVYKSSW